MLRSTLIVGATALLRHIRKGRHKPTPWLASLLERKPPKLVAVALANKFARIAWRLMISGGVYNRPVAAMPIADARCFSRLPGAGGPQRQ
jgi:transposase